MKFELFGRLKKHHAASARPTMREPPVDKVRKYVESGMPESEIIKTLKNTGYSFREIDAALNSALKTEVGDETYMNDNPFHESASESRTTESEPLHDIPEEHEFITPQVFKEEDEGSEKINVEELEEVVNSIANEKMRAFRIDLEKSTNNIIGFEKKLNSVSSGLETMKTSTDASTAEAEKKLEEIRAKLDELEPKIFGLERAFKDIMPNLVDSVREVKEAIHEMRTKDKKGKNEELVDDSFLNEDIEIINKLK